jgi:hypothetical protein
MWGVCTSLALAILTLTFGACGGKQVACLEISGEEPDRVLARLAVEPGVPFSLEFVNSIYLAPVKETLVYEPSEGISIIMVESPSGGVFEYYGLEPDGTGKALMHRKVGDIKLRSHDYTNHRLTFGRQVLQLKGLVPNGEPILVKVWVGSKAACDFVWR